MNINKTDFFLDYSRLFANLTGDCAVRYISSSTKQNMRIPKTAAFIADLRDCLRDGRVIFT